MKYSVDTSILIEAWVRHYPPDIFPRVWERLDQLIAGGVLIATGEVLTELEKKHDDLYAWAKQRSIMFVPLTLDIQEATRRVLAESRGLVRERTERSRADPFVIALALVEQCPVLTYEKPSNSPRRPKIPDVCQTFGVRCLDLVGLFREQGWVF